MAMEPVVSPVKVTAPLAGLDNSLHDAVVYVHRNSKYEHLVAN